MRRLLLDTHVYLWALSAPERLSTRVRDLVTNTDVAVFVSAVCVWEATIKRGLGRLGLADEVDLVHGIAASGFAELPATARHAALTAEVETRHADPFDRLLIAQAMAEDCTLVTVDREVLRSGGIDVLDATASSP